MKQRQLTVYFDGSCPLCRWEISHYRKQDNAGRLVFQDVSPEGAEVGPDLTRRQAMARFHVRGPDGGLLSGAAAFVAIWHVLPGWRWLARIGNVPGMMHFLELAYRAFLPLRPRLAQLVQHGAAAEPDRSHSGKHEQL